MLKTHGLCATLVAIVIGCTPSSPGGDAGPAGPDTGSGPDTGAPDDPGLMVPTNVLFGTVRAIASGASTPMPAVTVRLSNGMTTMTDDGGFFVFQNVAADPALVVTAESAGYVEAIQTVDVRDALPSSVDLALVQGTVQHFDAEAGGMVMGSHGAHVTFPAHALVTQTGTAVTGMVDAIVVGLDLSNDVERTAYPGGFEGTRTGGTASILGAIAPVGIVVRQGTDVLQLATGMTAQISAPLPAGATVDASVGFWSLSPTTGLWTEEATATAMADTSAASGMALVGAIPHLSWWNGTRWVPEVCLTGTVVDVDGSPAAYVPLTAYAPHVGGTYRGITDGSGMIHCLVVPAGEASLTVVAQRRGNTASAMQMISTAGQVDNPLAAACSGCTALTTMRMASAVPPPPPAPSPPNPTTLRGGFMLAFDQSSTWTSNGGTINPVCSPPNPREVSFNDIGWIASLRAQSLGVSCCTCTARSRTYALPATVNTATARLHGYFYTARSTGATFGAGDVRVSLVNAGASIGSRVLTPGMTQDGCVGSGETRVNVTNGAYFTLPLATLNSSSSIDHIEIDVGAYGCGPDNVSTAIGMMVVTP